MWRERSLLWGDQHGLNQELVFTFRIQRWLLFHRLQHDLGRSVSRGVLRAEKALHLELQPSGQALPFLS